MINLFGAKKGGPTNDDGAKAASEGAGSSDDQGASGEDGLSERQRELCEAYTGDFSDLKAVFFNTTLKPSPALSHTEGLMAVSRAIMQANGVACVTHRLADHVMPPGIYPDMTQHGAPADDWPALYKDVEAADIVVVGSPIWLGEKSSVCQNLIERLYAMSGQLNAAGQYAFYGKVAGCLVTGNEDGVKHVAAGVLYAMQHVGFTVPPQADAGWIGAVGPGPSYLDEGSGGPSSDFTQRNTTFMTWNLLHFARLLKDAGGVPAHGNQRAAWEAGCRFDHPNPEYR